MIKWDKISFFIICIAQIFISIPCTLHNSRLIDTER